MADWQESIGELTSSEMTPGYELLTPKGEDAERVAVIRTSDRISFRRCRRRWGWSSHLRHNLEPRTTATPLWFGSGVHFALEDFHGDQRFGTVNVLQSDKRLRNAESAPNPVATVTHQYRASNAFAHYVKATYKQDQSRLPPDWREVTPMAIAMLDYYQNTWLEYRDPLTTFVYNGRPQVEVSFRIPIPFDVRKAYPDSSFDRVEYSGVLDRVIIDEHGGLWIVEYKTAKSIYQLHYQVDSQIGTYIWAARSLYPDYEVMGVIYQQHLKDYPEGPRILANGSVSTAKNMRTSYALYREALLKLYGTVDKAPADNVLYLNQLARGETTEALYARDCFIRRDAIQRNAFNAAIEGEKIIMEVSDMLNPDLPMYPNPTRDCVYLCPWMGACVSLDDGSDWEYVIQQDFRNRPPQYDSWREFLPGGSKWQQPLLAQNQQ